MTMRFRVSSFRARIFLVTMLIVSLVLASVALLGWSSVLNYEMQNLDDRLCGEARRLARMPPPPHGLAHLQADMAGKLRLTSPDQLLTWFDGDEPMSSSSWPPQLNPEQLTWTAQHPLERDPPVRRARPPRRDGPPQEGPPEGPQEGPPGPSVCYQTSFTARQSDWRAAKVTTPRGQGIVAADLAATRSELWTVLRRASSIALPLALLLTAAGAWLLSTLAMRPVARLREAMKIVNGKALDQRLSTDNEDLEFKDLINSYNTMLERLAASFNQASRFSADAAHELKTPLTILQGQLERAIAISENRIIQVNLIDMLDEVGRLSQISRKLLMLSQADSGNMALLKADTDLSLMLNESVADARMLELDVDISSHIPEGIIIPADQQLLSQVLNNLSSNAIKYTPAGGWIKIIAKARPTGIEVLFSNSSEVLSSEARARFFDRFFRAEASHSRKVDGHGLGLSLSRVIAQAHGGDLTLEPTPDHIVTLRLWLPHADHKATSRASSHRSRTSP